MARLTTGLFVSALLREVHARGGTGVVIRKGDQTSGALLLLCAEKGCVTGIYDYVLNLSGHYTLAGVLPEAIENMAMVEALCARRAGFDPDLWIIELDIAHAERFIADFASRD
ncbi:MAG: DUF1491 family protein [Pseudomonadota bacterium]